MAMFLQIDEKAAVLILAAVILGIWFYVAPDQAASTFVGIKEALLGVLP
ncbi:hypothetical protein [Halorubrum sp. SD626R]|nr:hypothetical protein [Halorubrum sp. SD626R]